MKDSLDSSHTAPKFAAPDPGALAAWYAEHLGFPRKTVYLDGAYALVSRGDLTLHIWRCPDRHIAENTACYTELRDVAALDALHAELSERAAAPGFAPGRVQDAPRDQPGHGMREFHVWDPAGNLIGFGAALPSEDPLAPP